jgi:ABC-type dipeptide/oligopeptide/nickel transport system permease component
MALCAGAVLLAALASGRASFAAGFGLGAALAILNYFWLQQAVARLMTAGKNRPSKWMVTKFLLRYPLAFAAVWIFCRTGWLPFMAVLAGLFVPVAGVLIEGTIQLAEGFSHGGTQEGH